MNRLKRNRPLLDYIIRAEPTTVKAIFKTLKQEDVQFFGEICANLLAGALKINTSNKTLLRPYAEIIRKVARREIRPITRQRLLIKNSEAIIQLIKLIYSKLYPKNGSH